jgi:hypothetical protein
MGCDYYILKCLKVEHKNGVAYIEIGERERAYFIYDFNVDSDDEEYNKKYDEWIGLHLQPSMNPVLIYSNGAFVRDYFEDKYGKRIDDCIVEHARHPPGRYSRDKGQLKSRQDIVTISKVELRELR